MKNGAVMRNKKKSKYIKNIFVLMKLENEIKIKACYTDEIRE